MWDSENEYVKKKVAMKLQFAAVLRNSCFEILCLIHRKIPKLNIFFIKDEEVLDKSCKRLLVNVKN